MKKQKKRSHRALLYLLIFALLSILLINMKFLLHLKYDTVLLALVVSFSSFAIVMILSDFVGKISNATNQQIDQAIPSNSVLSYEEIKEIIDAEMDNIQLDPPSENPKSDSSSESPKYVKNNFVINPLSIMNMNLKNIVNHYLWSMILSILSFAFAVIMSSVGLLLIGKIVFYNEGSEKVNLIGIVGGVASEFVAATAMVAFRLSLKNLKHYHSSLHENERLMTSLAVIDKISTGKDKDEMYKKVIEYQMQISLKEVSGVSSKEKSE